MADTAIKIGAVQATFSFDPKSVDLAVEGLEKKLQAAIKNTTKGLEIELKIDEKSISQKIEKAVENAAKKIAKVDVPIEAKVADAVKPVAQNVNVAKQIEQTIERQVIAQEKVIQSQEAQKEAAKKVSKELEGQVSIFDKIGVSSANASEKVEQSVDQEKRAIDKLKKAAEEVSESIKNIGPDGHNGLDNDLLMSDADIKASVSKIAKLRAEAEKALIGAEKQGAGSEATLGIKDIIAALDDYEREVREGLITNEEFGESFKGLKADSEAVINSLKLITSSTSAANKEMAYAAEKAVSDMSATQDSLAKELAEQGKEYAAAFAQGEKQAAAEIKESQNEIYDAFVGVEKAYEKQEAAARKAAEADKMLADQKAKALNEITRAQNEANRQIAEARSVGLDSDVTAPIEAQLDAMEKLKNNVEQNVVGNKEFASSIGKINDLLRTSSSSMKSYIATAKDMTKQQQEALNKIVKLYVELDRRQGEAGKPGNSPLQTDIIKSRIVALKDEIDSATKEYERMFEVPADKLYNTVIMTDDLSKAIWKMNEQWAKNEAATTRALNSQQITMRKLAEQLNTTVDKLNKAGAPVDVINKGMKLTDELMRKISKNELISNEQFQRDVLKIKTYQEEVHRLGYLNETIGHSITRIFGEKFGYGIMAALANSARQAIRQIYTNVVDLDSAMTELRKVTNETSATYNRFLDSAARNARKLGVSMKDLVNATADFARLGYDITDASSLAEVATVYRHVGDGITDISEASESIISTMKAFGIEAENAMEIVDKFNEVGNNFAISSSGIGEALVRSASSLHTANNSLDESIAMITAANSVVQDPQKVGTALRSSVMFLRAAKTEAEEAGEDIEGMANSVSELREELLKLTNGKVDIMLDDRTFKSSFQIYRELASVWDKLADVDRSNILELIGGRLLPRRTVMCA